MEILQVGAMWTFLGVLITALFNFILGKIKEKNKTQNNTHQQNLELYQQFNRDVYKEIGRLSNEIEQLKKENKEKNEENLRLKKENYKLKVDFDELKEDYKELKQNYLELKEINEGLRNKIDEMMKKVKK